MCVCVRARICERVRACARAHELGRVCVKCSRPPGEREGSNSQKSVTSHVSCLLYSLRTHSHMHTRAVMQQRVTGCVECSVFDIECVCARIFSFMNSWHFLPCEDFCLLTPSFILYWRKGMLKSFTKTLQPPVLLKYM